jgi:hypothetical protein
LIPAGCGAEANLEEIALVHPRMGSPGSLEAVQNWSAELRKEGPEFNFMLLVKGEQPTNPERRILIEIIQKPVIG